MRKSTQLCFFIFILSIFNGKAQNLIANGDFGVFDSSVLKPLPGGYQTSYNQIPYNGTTIPGSYAIVKDPFPLFPSVLKSFTDHTTANSAGVGANNMLFVDGKNYQVFWKQTPALILKAGVTYTFSYWIKNANQTVNPSNPAPKIKFNPIGCSSCTTQTYDLGVVIEWALVSYSITPTINESVSIELSTVGALPAGNNFVIDDVSLIASPTPLTISNSKSNPSCPNGSDGTIVAYPNGGVFPYTFSLNGNSTITNASGVFQGLSGGDYIVSVSDSDTSPKIVSTKTISINSPLDIVLTNTPKNCLLSGSPITLTANNGGNVFNWSASTGIPILDKDNSTIVNPIINTTYSISSTSSKTNFNLIENGDFESGTSGFYSNYVYATTKVSIDKSTYGVVSNSKTWDSSLIDSQDNGGSGKMFVTDASTTVNSVVWSQSVSVETLKAYDFSFWAQNLSSSNFAQFQVSINDITIPISQVSANNNGISSGWTKITGTWSSGLSTLATLKIIDTNILGSGNDFALDDISFSTLTSKSCDLSTQLTVNIGGTIPITSFSYLTPICKSGSNPIPFESVGFFKGGVYSETTGLLSINSTTGEINLASSTSGTYTIKYSVAENIENCQSAGFTTFEVTISSTAEAPIIIPKVNYCKDGPSSSLVATALPNGILNWYGTNEVGGTASSQAPVPETSTVKSTTYYVSQSIGVCESPRKAILVVISPITNPIFVQVNPICVGGSLSPPLTTSNNGITGTWSPAINNTTTTTYTFTPDGGQCATTAKTTVTVNPLITPQFNTIAPICFGTTLTPLPTISNNGIMGTWSPALNNTATTKYTFTPSAGQCGITTDLTISVNPNVTPTFDAVAPVCSGAALADLPTTSTNGIIGTWSPPVNTTTTTSYLFTSSSSFCASTTQLTITINQIITPTFSFITSLCSGATLNNLPTTSSNGITGTWSPSINNTATTTYIFTPDTGQCATTAQTTVTVNPLITPQFNPIAPVCSGTILSPLPTTSTNGITGTWSPALNNTVTTKYTFTPSAGQCGITTHLTITVNSNVTPTFDAIAPVCSGATLADLPTTSTNGILGNWFPTINNTATTTYIFTPNGNQCATIANQIITINNSTVKITAGCKDKNYTLEAYPSESGVEYTWYRGDVILAEKSSSLIVTEIDTYKVAVFGRGCLTEDIENVTSFNCNLFIPKGISPNGDSKNDVFDLSDFDVAQLEIFNRFGKKVYTKSNYQKEWDGTNDSGQELQAGTYYYVIHFNKDKSETGWVYINREH